MQQPWWHQSALHGPRHSAFHISPPSGPGHIKLCICSSCPKVISTLLLSSDFTNNPCTCIPPSQHPFLFSCFYLSYPNFPDHLSSFHFDTGRQCHSDRTLNSDLHRCRWPKSSISSCFSFSPSLPPEFAFIFSLYRDIICSPFPDCRSELDDCLSLILDLALRLSGYAFYTYHILFTSQAAGRLQQFNQGTNWGTLDPELYCRVFVARSSLNCDLCGAPSHPVTLLCLVPQLQINRTPPFSAACPEQPPNHPSPRNQQTPSQPPLALFPKVWMSEEDQSSTSAAGWSVMTTTI